jgi:hypothetical protein
LLFYVVVTGKERNKNMNAMVEKGWMKRSVCLKNEREEKLVRNKKNIPSLFIHSQFQFTMKNAEA